jgi:hypothetical protein
MQAALWGTDHFGTYLHGCHFVLFTNYKPLSSLGKVHTRTLNRLQEAMNEFNFEISYKKGNEMPADFLSQNMVVISWESRSLAEAQNHDQFLGNLKIYLLRVRRWTGKEKQQQSLLSLFSRNVANKKLPNISVKNVKFVIFSLICFLYLCHGVSTIECKSKFS